MHQPNQLAARSDDHALEPVPDGARQNWLQLSWSTAGIVTTLVQLFLGALTTFVAGFRIAIVAGVAVTIIGSLLGWGMGHVAYRTGLASTVLSRRHGLGQRGSVLLALVFGFMIIGFIALENAMLYKGFLFYTELADTLALRLLVYGGLTLAWILLTAFGFSLVSRVASSTLIAFLAVLVYMLFDVIASSGQSWASVLQYGAQVPPQMLQAMGADSDSGKFIFCVNVLIGSAGALALMDADLGRYARSSRDIALAALAGNLFMDVVMVAVGGIIMYAGMDQLIAHYVRVDGLAPEAARALALQSPDSVAAAFIIFGGALGTLLMVLAQSKAQVLNTYSASLSLTSLFDALFGWRPGRVVFVVLANLLACLMLSGAILEWVNGFITVLGVLTTCFCGIILADYFIVAPRRAAAAIPDVNLAGVATLVLAFVLAHFVLQRWLPLEFFTALVVCLLVYPLLSLNGARRAGAAAAR